LSDTHFANKASEVKGSYAGAMGWGQFMPTSIIKWARDGDGDGQIDLWASRPDIIASVANYFVAHGWKSGETVTVPAKVSADAKLPELRATETLHSIGSLRDLGFSAQAQLADATPATVLELEGAQGKETWITLHNFYVISRYNRSPLYSMAVHQLSGELREAMRAANAP
jgi:membrane-bound lytic murein transglycosylase B